MATSTFTLCSRRGTYGTQLALVTRLVPGDAAPFCVAGVAFGDIHLHFAWQAWHLATSTCTLCGRRGTYGTQLALFRRLVPGVALGDIDLWGRRGTWRHRPSLCVAGVALVTCGIQPALVMRLVRGEAAPFCVAGMALGVALGNVDLTLCRGRGILRRRHSVCVAGTYGAGLALVTPLVPGHAAPFCVAGVALGDIHLRFAWQATFDWYTDKYNSSTAAKDPSHVRRHSQTSLDGRVRRQSAVVIEMTTEVPIGDEEGEEANSQSQSVGKLRDVQSKEPDQHPLKDQLTAKKVNINEVREILKHLEDLPRWLEEPLVSGSIPKPLIVAVADNNPDLVGLLIEFRADFSKPYDAPSSYKGWIKPGQSLLSCVSNRKGRFVGTMLADRLTKIEEMLTVQDAEQVIDDLDALEVGSSKSAFGAIAATWGTDELSKPRHTQGHPKGVYEVLEHLDDGDTSTVWGGVHLPTKVSVAIKIEVKSAEAEEQRDLLKRRQRFAKKLLDALHGEAFKACEELMAEHEKLREVDGYKHIFKALQSIETVSIVKRTEAFDRFFDAMNRRRGQPVDGYIRQRKQQWNELQDLADGVQMSEDLKAYFMLKGAGLSREDRRMILLANQSSYTMDGIEKALRTSFYDVHEKERQRDAPGFQRAHSRKGSGKRSYAVGSEDAASWTAVSGEETIPEDEEDEDAFAVDGETWNDDAETYGEDQSDYGASGDDEVFQAYSAMDQSRRSYKDSRRKLKEVQKSRGFYKGDGKGSQSREQAKQAEKERTRCGSCNILKN
eukprot:s349_g13.t1